MKDEIDLFLKSTKVTRDKFESSSDEEEKNLWNLNRSGLENFGLLVHYISIAGIFF